MDIPAKITARVAPYLDAIRQARAGGWGWREIADRVAPGATPDSVRAAMKTCKYKVEQMPLPEVQGQKNSKQHLGMAPSAFTEKRPLPGQQIPVGDADAIVNAVEEKLGTNFFK